MEAQNEDKSYGSFCMMDLDRRPEFCAVLGSCGGCRSTVAAFDHWRDQIEQGAPVMAHQDGDLRHRIRPMIASPSIVEYRSRVQLRGRMGADGAVALGYFAAGGRRFVPVADCPIAEPPLRHLIRRLTKPHQWSEADSGECGQFRLVLTALDQGQVLVSMLSGGTLDESQARALRRQIEAFPGAIFRPQGEEQLPELFVWDRAGELSFYCHAEVFVQSHRQLNRSLRAVVRDAVRESGARRVVDAYCGHGNLSLGLAAEGFEVLGIESSRESLRAYERSVNEAGLGERVRLVLGKVRFDRLAAEVGDDAVLVVDPPRTGIGEQVEGLRDLGPRQLIYVSCSTASLLKDWQVLGLAYELRSLQPLQMYPQQGECEMVATFRRR
jgi:tRNA/tmRNA/rRNA uracil-C5-methylase (TrmA/RlmC/RlmD family)